MKLIIITTEHIFEGEAEIINQLFETGMETLHLRKPAATEQDIRLILSQILPCYHHRIVLHDHFALTQEFALKGVHLNRRNPAVPTHKPLSISKSCHSLNELANTQAYNYVFLSPIFDSISKHGYHQAFTEEELLMAKKDGRIHSNIYALGGISIDTIPLAAHYGFGGVAVLGALWGNYSQDKDKTALLTRWNKLNSKTYT